MMAETRRGASLGDIPKPEPEKQTEPKAVRATSKQTIEIGRKALARIREICTLNSLSFQDFAIAAINRELDARGEPSIEEIEAR